MGKNEKLIKRFLGVPKDFTYNELKTMLSGLGYHEVKVGKTSGSRVNFWHDKFDIILRLHKPHPKNILKRYQMEQIKDELKRLGLVK